MPKVSWLHLTDLHFGLRGQGSLWPNVKGAFFDDLKKLHARTGPWNLVLFTGDLVQKGTSDEYKDLEERVLAPLWKEMKKLGSEPQLLAVPGNHDLVRPDIKSPPPALRLLLNSSAYPEVSDELLLKPESDYRAIVSTAFQNYSNWWRNNSYRTVKVQRGLLPGDFSADLCVDGIRFGVVGLNTAFLQLADGDYRERLEWDVRQLNTACTGDPDGDGDAWIRDRHMCLLLTHHGPEWLSCNSREVQYPEINPAGRFAVHLFGHMHENVIRSSSQGGGAVKRLWQGNSIFGLERFGDPPKVDRRHGYSVGQISVEGDIAILRHWPRKAFKDSNGWRFERDVESCILEDDDGGTSPELFRCREVEICEDYKVDRDEERKRDDDCRWEGRVIDNRVKAFLINYLGSSERSVPFGGRARSLAELDAWLNETGIVKPYVLVTAPAGRGKSALVANWAKRHWIAQDAHVIFAPISIRYQTARQRDFLSILARELSPLVDEISNVDEMSESAISSHICDYLRTDQPPGKTLVVILDGIDEAINWEISPVLIPLAPGRGVRIVATARTLPTYENWTDRLGWDDHLCKSLGLTVLDLHGIRDVLDLMGGEARQHCNDMELVSALYRMSEEGDPLLIRLYIDAILSSEGSKRFISLDDFKNSTEGGLKGYFNRWRYEQETHWKDNPPLAELRHRWLFNVLAGAFGPIGREQLLQIAPRDLDLSTYSLDRFLHSLSRLVLGDGRAQGLVFAHPRLAQYFWDDLTKSEKQKIDAQFCAWGEALRDELRNGQGDRLPDYLLRNYSMHLIRSGASLVQVSRLVDRNWVQAWTDHDRSYGGLLGDIERIWKFAASKAKSLGEPEQYSYAIRTQLRCALLTASINSVTANVPVALAFALLDAGIWSPEQALAQARANSDPFHRATFLAGIVDRIQPGPLRDKVTSMALASLELIGSSVQRVEVMATLARMGGKEWIGRFLSKAFSLGRAEGVRMLAIAAPMLTGALCEFAVAWTIESPDASETISALEALAGCQLAESQVVRIFESVKHLSEAYAAPALSQLAPLLRKDECVQVLDIVSNWNDKAAAVGVLIRLLKPDTSTEQVNEAPWRLILELCRGIASNESKAVALASAMRCAAGLVCGRLIIEGATIPSSVAKVPFWIALTEIESTRWPEILAETKLVRHESERMHILAGLIDFVPHDYFDLLRAVCMSMDDPYWRAPALGRLFCRDDSVYVEFSRAYASIQLQKAREDVLALLCERARGDSRAGEFLASEVDRFSAGAFPAASLKQYVVGEAERIAEKWLPTFFSQVWAVKDARARAICVVSLCMRQQRQWTTAIQRCLRGTAEERIIFVQEIAPYAPPGVLWTALNQARIVGDHFLATAAKLRCIEKAKLWTINARFTSVINLIPSSDLPKVATRFVDAVTTSNAESLYAELRRSEPSALSRLLRLWLLSKVSVDVDRFVEDIAHEPADFLYWHVLLSVNRAEEQGVRNLLRLSIPRYVRDFRAGDILLAALDRPTGRLLASLRDVCLDSFGERLHWLCLCLLEGHASRPFVDQFARRAAADADQVGGQFACFGFRVLCEPAGLSDRTIYFLIQMVRCQSDQDSIMAALRAITPIAGPEHAADLLSFVLSMPNGWRKVTALSLIHQRYARSQNDVRDALSAVGGSIELILASMLAHRSVPYLLATALQHLRELDIVDGTQPELIVRLCRSLGPFLDDLGLDAMREATQHLPKLVLPLLRWLSKSDQARCVTALAVTFQTRALRRLATLLIGRLARDGGNLVLMLALRCAMNPSQAERLCKADQAARKTAFHERLTHLLDVLSASELSFASIYRLAYDRETEFLHYQMDSGVSEVEARCHLYLTEGVGAHSSAIVSQDVPGTEPADDDEALALWSSALHSIARRRRSDVLEDIDEVLELSERVGGPHLPLDFAELIEETQQFFH